MLAAVHSLGDAGEGPTETRECQTGANTKRGESGIFSLTAGRVELVANSGAVQLRKHERFSSGMSIGVRAPLLGLRGF
jgi:hypothetical protein